MLIRCPDCGTEGQEVGKFCENCGRMLSEADAGATMSEPPTAPTAPVPDPAAQAASSSGAGASIGTATATSSVKGAQFAVVDASGPNASVGFTIRQIGEFLVGRPNAETGVNPDIDVRQWVQPLDIGGQKQYLVHRRQCFLGLTADGAATIRAAEGAELDTLVKPAGQDKFIPLQEFSTTRPPLPNQAETYPLEPGDQIYMGDPEAVKFFQTGDPTAREGYLVLELLPQAP